MLTWPSPSPSPREWERGHTCTHIHTHTARGGGGMCWPLVPLSPWPLAASRPPQVHDSSAGPLVHSSNMASRDNTPAGYPVQAMAGPCCSGRRGRVCVCMYTVPYPVSSSHHGAVSIALKRDDIPTRYYVHCTYMSYVYTRTARARAGSPWLHAWDR